MNKNSENPKIGRLFQESVCKMMEQHYSKDFDLEVPIQIGRPAKNHRFDCVSKDKKIVIECKCYTWTVTGNSPSAKLGTLNEAVFYLNFLPKDATKVLVIKKASHPKKTETLAEHYYKRYSHLLEGITLMEADVKTNELKII